jgi:hypothetical protein
MTHGEPVRAAIRAIDRPHAGQRRTSMCLSDGHADTCWRMVAAPMVSSSGSVSHAPRVSSPVREVHEGHLRGSFAAVITDDVLDLLHRLVEQHA